MNLVLMYIGLFGFLLSLLRRIIDEGHSLYAEELRFRWRALTYVIFEIFSIFAISQLVEYCKKEGHPAIIKEKRP